MHSFKLLFAAEHVVRDADSNKVSAFNIFDGIVAESLPLLLPSFTVLTVTERTAADDVETTATLRISLGEQQLLQGNFVVNFRDKLLHRHLSRVEGLLIPTPGRLVIHVALATGVTAEYAFTIDTRQQPNLFEDAGEQGQHAPTPAPQNP